MDPPTKQGEWAGPWLGFRRGDSMVQDTAGFGKKTVFIFLAFRAGEAGLSGSHTAEGSIGAPRGKGEHRDCPQGATGAPTTLLGRSAKPTGQFLERDVGVSEVGKGLARLPSCRHRGLWLEVSGCLPWVQGGSRPATLSLPSPVGVPMLTGLGWPGHCGGGPVATTIPQGGLSAGLTRGSQGIWWRVQRCEEEDWPTDAALSQGLCSSTNQG